MDFSMNTYLRFRTLAALAIIAIAIVAVVPVARGATQSSSTPTPQYSCDNVSARATPGMPMGTMETPGMGMPGMATPGSGGMGMNMSIDMGQMYINMMVPHHASIIALSEAALPELTDERLKSIAAGIIDKQTAEIEELGQLRRESYGDSTVMPMDNQMMDMMMQMMPGMGSREDMSSQMDPDTQVATFCAAENPDLAFIDLVIPHHQMAIMSSQHVVESDAPQPVKDFAQRVIDDQQAEIEKLEEIRADLAS